MMNAKEARENMKKYQEAQEMARLARVTRWLEGVEKRIESASLNGHDNVVITDMDILSDSALACGMLVDLGFKVERLANRGALRISW